MKDYVIFLDASADYVPELCTREDIRIVPMSFTAGGASHTSDGPAEGDFLRWFYNGQRKGELTQTSQITPQQYVDVFSPVLAEGKPILYLALSSGLTNTVNSALVAAADLAEAFPETPLRVVDTLCATGGMGLLAERAAAYRQEGLSLEENALRLEADRQLLRHTFMVEDLMYLKRGGRISAATAVAGTILGIHPILVIDPEGRLIVVSKKRGEKQALSEMVSRYARERDPAQGDRVFIVHADAPVRAAQLADALRKENPGAEISTSYLCPVIGAHTGPGMCAAIYFGAPRS